ncbi:MAG TPA: hypothetical protein VFI24_07740 [Pyrinomonadaceae bacterium]|nr:hypothetical protein [Pyrinomonadaceae bacterium]
MKFITKRNLLAGIATLLIGVGTSAAIWGMPKFLKRSTTIKGQINAFLLDDEGAVNGLLLSTGDQLHFNRETGLAVASQIKVGDEVAVVGHAGTQSKYGREVRVDQLTANGRTILAIGGPPRPHDHHRPGPRHEFDEQLATPPSADTTSAAPEILSTTGAVQTHLVNGHGDVDGLIMQSGEQIRLSPRVGQLVVAAEQSGNTQLNVEGPVVRTERGVVIRPTSITVGNQTITLGRD